MTPSQTTAVRTDGSNPYGGVVRSRSRSVAFSMGEDQDGEYGGSCGSQKRHVIKPKPKAQPKKPEKAKLWL